VQTGAVAAPISYAVDGKQYVALVAGWGGAMPLAGGKVAAMAGVQNRSRLLVYSLEGTQQLPAPAELVRELAPPPLGDAGGGARIAVCGALLPATATARWAAAWCPGLRYASVGTHAEFDASCAGARHRTAWSARAGVRQGDGKRSCLRDQTRCGCSPEQAAQAAVGQRRRHRVSCRRTRARVVEQPVRRNQCQLW
jgi:hypothetical protein